MFFLRNQRTKRVVIYSKLGITSAQFRCSHLKNMKSRHTHWYVYNILLMLFSMRNCFFDEAHKSELCNFPPLQNGVGNGGISNTAFHKDVYIDCCNYATTCDVGEDCNCLLFATEHDFQS